MRGLSIALLVLLASAAAPGPAAAGGETRTLRFRGQEVRVPASWPVFRLADRPGMCVRLDRRAVYLGTPSPEQRCPASAIGYRRAILVQPQARRRGTQPHAGASRLPQARLADTSGYTGLGFDACTAPSRRAMSAWGSSPYRAIGVYIGGLNRACSQPNLTAGWVREHTARGWHLIPTYVGLQAPTSSCTSCATLSGGAAASQGASAAADAVSDARTVGIGPGSPIYFDMEAYTRTTSATGATLTFLASWTTRLHGLGYTSGVYSSSASGIADLVSRLGTRYQQPDDIWIANWNGRKSTDDPFVPARAWSDHQRIHQYRGGHNETWGGVTINIDNNYVEGATAGASSSDDPLGRLELAASPRPGQVRIAGWAFDPSAPAKPVQILAYVGGRQGGGGAARHQLGPIAAQPRPDLALVHRAAGANHGFDASFPTVKSGKRRVCVYAVDIGPGSDALLGCKGTGIAVPISLSELRGSRNGVQLRLRCEWPAGTECPGQILLRARKRVRVPARRRGRRARTRVVRVRIGRRAFRMTGERSRALRLRLNRRGRLLARAGGRLRAQLVVAIPGGSRVTRRVMLGRGG